MIMKRITLKLFATKYSGEIASLLQLFGDLQTTVIMMRSSFPLITIIFLFIQEFLSGDRFFRLKMVGNVPISRIQTMIHEARGLMEIL